MAYKLYIFVIVLIEAVAVISPLSYRIMYMENITIINNNFVIKRVFN